MGSITKVERRKQNSGYYGKFVNSYAQIAIILIVIPWILLCPVCSQPDDKSSILDKPFSQPQYWLHATGHGTMDGLRTDDWWFLFPRQPKDGFIEIPDGYGGTFTYSIDQVSGPYATPRDACQAAPSAIGRPASVSEWGSSESFTCSDNSGNPSCEAECKGRDSHLIWNGKDEYPYCNCVCESGWEFDAAGKNCVPTGTSNMNPCEAECKGRAPAGQLSHQIWNGKDEYPYCNCVCEDGWEFDVSGKVCVPVGTSNPNDNTVQTLVTTPQGTTPIKPGDKIKITLTNGESVSLEVFCRELQKKIGIMAAIYGDQRSKLSVAEAELSLGLGLLSANEYICGNRVSVDYDMAPSGSTGGSSVEINMKLRQGPIRAEVVNDLVSLDIETPTVIVSSQGKNTFGIAYDPTSGKSEVAAYQNPVQVQPTNNNHAPFTLEPGQQVEVSAGQAGHSTTLGQVPGERTTQIPGSIPKGSKGGCYADPVTGEIVCVDSNGEPSDAQVEMQGGCYQDPSTGQFVCVDTFEGLSNSGGSWEQQSEGVSSVSPPASLQECETYTSEICGRWNLEGDHYIAEWDNGATAVLNIERCSPTDIVLTRYDSAGSSAGLSARYEGQISGNAIRNGRVTWSWNGNTWSGTWEASW